MGHAMTSTPHAARSGIRLEQLRYDAGLTIDELADHVPGVGARTIARIEAGQTRRPWPKTAKAIADFFGVTSTELLERLPPAGQADAA
jgi:transcriptional regulator with XRE-family HTH domain